MRRVARIRAENFRGIPRELILDFRPKDGKPPRSLLLLGDNGSGKSSIVDALEFALRASLLRRLDPDRPVKRVAQNLASRLKPYVEVTFGDGTSIARGAPGDGRFNDGVRKVLVAEPDFAIAPLVLRRADVLGFWQLAPERRKLVFFDYFRPSDATEQARLQVKSQESGLEARLKSARSTFEKARAVLADVAGISVEAVPQTANGLRDFRQGTLAKAHGTGRTGRYGEAHLAKMVLAPYQAAVNRS